MLGTGRILVQFLNRLRLWRYLFLITMHFDKVIVPLLLEVLGHHRVRPLFVHISSPASRLLVFLHLLSDGCSLVHVGMTCVI